MTNENLDNMNGQEIKELIETETITIDKLNAAALKKLMDYETDMLCFGNGNVELISQCSDLLDSVRENGISDETVACALNKAKADYNAETIAANACGSSPKRKRRSLRRLVMVAAAISLVLAASAVIPTAFGHSNRSHLYEFIEQGEGAIAHEGSETFYYKGRGKEYGSIEELIRAENLNIMYPSAMPEGVDITQICFFDNSIVGEKDIEILTSNKKITVVISTDVPEHSQDYGDHEIIYNGDMKFCVFYEHGYFAYCYYNGNTYGLHADSYENIVFIINSFKEE